MADNVAVTEGSGTTIATDQVGTVHYQKVKLVESTADSEAAIGVSGNPLAVVQTGALPAGTNGIGKLTANSGVDIGDVDILSIAAGTNIIGAVKRDVINYTGINKYYANTGAATDGIVWSPAAGKQVALTDLTLSTSEAATVTLEWDKTGGDEILLAWDLAANGGVTINFQTPIICSEDDADLVITTSAGNIKVAVSGYEV